MKLSDFLTQPDSFEGRPWRYAVNQAGHMLLGALLAYFLTLPVAVLIYLAWEAVQVVRFNAKPSDSIEDFGFVMCGAILSAPSAALGVVFLVAGTARRLEAKR